MEQAMNLVTGHNLFKLNVPVIHPDWISPLCQIVSGVFVTLELSSEDSRSVIRVSISSMWSWTYRIPFDRPSLLKAMELVDISESESKEDEYKKIIYSLRSKL